MIRRPLTLTVATLCGALALTACNGSPEAGRPDPTPTSASPTPTPTAPSTPAWTPEEQASVTAATAQYKIARAAIDAALHSPSTATRAKLAQAGNGGAWIIDVLGDVKFNQDHGWYQEGRVVIESVSVASVKLQAPQPEVRLNVCLDTSKTSIRYQANRKPVPVGPDNGDRHKAQAALVYAPPAGQTKKMWFLVAEEGSGTC
ncbi:hypothetical protein EV646_11957 [Kribbella antiqua]|uniref:Lipoprotein n=1 Tax=Kribbella antiqua TaxID=2512217 RepID=A0A4R2I935_9ACTN|nr:hypothetical protein [Kribbella antiqua]TCO39015.1 hypothetical protein EV646_11957 [Kribbella antiqua]